MADFLRSRHFNFPAFFPQSNVLKGPSAVSLDAEIGTKHCASAWFQAAVDAHLSGVWSSVPMKKLHSSWGERCFLQGSACRARADARCYISICDSCTVQGIIWGTITVWWCGVLLRGFVCWNNERSQFVSEAKNMPRWKFSFASKLKWSRTL